MISSIDERMKLTAAQLPVLRLASKGFTIQEIAEALKLEPTTIVGRQRKMIVDNKCRNLTHLCCKAIRNGVIQ